MTGDVLRTLADQATPGPWSVTADEAHPGWIVERSEFEQIVYEIPSWDDARLIAAMGPDAARLLAGMADELERLHRAHNYQEDLPCQCPRCDRYRALLVRWGALGEDTT